ncbi:MAG: SpoIIE family protein phosphatase [Desulfobacterales bacterium]|nr:MAG: SpoIIE family protein phosphatase [Desulfobacterales bacterium]
MRFRWKLLILLLSIAMVPIMTGRVFSLHALRKLGDTLVARSRDNRVAYMKNHLRLLVDSYSSVLWVGREHMEMALKYQAREVEYVLAGDPLASNRVYFAEDFDKDKHLPDDMIPSSVHLRALAEDKMEFLNVSYFTQVFKLVPGVEKKDVNEDIKRLSALTPVYRDVAKRFPDLIIWQYTSLENGLQSIYPGHGGIPKKWDHRKQAWYTEALQSDRKAPPWSEPYVDPETRQLVIAATLPVKRRTGEIAGVTALISPLSHLLERKLLVKNVPSETRSFMCYLDDVPKTDHKNMVIVASDEYTDIKHRSWITPRKTEWLTSSNVEQLQAMISDLEIGHTNIRRMPYRGHDSLWAYGKLGFKGFLVLITPYEEILKPANQAKEYIQTRINRMVNIIWYLMSGMIVFVFILAMAFSRTVTKPIQALSDGAKSLLKGNFNARVAIRSRDEFGEMGRLFNTLGPQLQEHYQWGHSMELAKEVQQNLLPASDPLIEGLDIAGKSIYCDKTGGDYYDFLEIGQPDMGKITVVVGDVSDHGIPSALLMTTARALIRQRYSMSGNISQIVSDVNRQLTKDVQESGQFMTLFYSEIDARGKNMKWIRSGHDPALLYDQHTETFDELAGTGIPLGVSESTIYEANYRKLAAGQIIVIGTDGIWETRNATGEMFGKENLKKIVRDQAKAPATEIVATVIDKIEIFRRPFEKEDDITLVVIKIEHL